MTSNNLTDIIDGSITSGGVADNACVVHPHIQNSSTDLGRDATSMLNEIVNLSGAIGLNVTISEIIKLVKPHPGHLFGKGQIERINEQILNHNMNGENGPIKVVIVNGVLTPIQQRNLEKSWDCKVIDRTGLILEIFGERAQTKEGRLQVELAALSYQRGRLVRSWTHLERQRGGAGFMGGPGERQIETDRRLIAERITALKSKLVDVIRTRQLHRSARKRVPFPVVAFVGYTNAGKSTLFNTFTNSSVIAKDQLFATLDPTMRRLDLPSGRTVILSDTVGFISNLPHELVNAFRATLEEVIEADLIVHLHDAAHPECEAQKRDVEQVLGQLKIPDFGPKKLINAYNKVDLLDPAQKLFVDSIVDRSPSDTVIISAVSGDGLPKLLDLIDDKITATFVIQNHTLEYADGARLAWFYENGDVISRTDDEKGIHLSVRLSQIHAHRLEALQKSQAKSKAKKSD